MGIPHNNQSRSVFTDQELIAELRQRAAWRSGSQTTTNILTQAADRLERLTAFVADVEAQIRRHRADPSASRSYRIGTEMR